MTDSKRYASREDMARREIGVTAVSRAQAWVLVIVFLGLSAAVPLVQVVVEMSDRESGPGVPHVLSLFSNLGEVGVAYARSAPSHADAGPAGAATLPRRVFAANSQLLAVIHRYDEDLENRSVLSRWLISPVQAWFLRVLGQGNEKAYPGRDGWAFFRNDVEYLTGPPFLDSRQLERRENSGSEWISAPQPDPRRAILAFKDYLARRDISLVLVPTPVKPSVHPAQLSGRYDGSGNVVQNPSFGPFVQQLEQAGVLVFDPAPILHQAATGTGAPQYLRTDTHWRPEAMERTAGRLGKFIADGVNLDAVDGVEYRTETREIIGLGDIVVNLLQIEASGIYEAETVEIHPVIQSDGSPWAANEDADILFMGDSFANIYSMSNLNWGQGAGLAEQLSFAMQRDVDVIAMNDDGAFATRLQLARDLTLSDRLAGKRVVVWQFATRELAQGDWRMIDWERIPVGGATRPEVVTGGEAEIRGRIVQVTRPPRPGTVTYKDCIIQVHLMDVSGEIETDELVIHAWGMFDNVWTPATDWRVGQEIALSVTDWDTASAERGLTGMRQEPLDDPDLELIELPVFWTDVEIP